MDSSNELGNVNEPSDAWQNSSTRDVFHLPVSCSQLEHEMKRAGEILESSGGAHFRPNIQSLYYRLNCLPEVHAHQDCVEFTWKYASHEYLPPTDVAVVPVIHWRVLNAEPGVTVHAYCRDERFRSYFFKLKEVAVIRASNLAVKKSDIALPTNESHTMVQVTGLAESPADANRKGGPPRMLCNYWAYAEYILGRTPSEILPEYTILWELENQSQGTGLDDLADSLSKGIARMRKIYDNKLKR